MSDLLSCPFCGSSKVELRSDGEFQAHPYWVHCDGCGMATQDWADAESCRKHWNTRSGSQGVEVSEELAETVARMFCNTAIGIRSWSKFTQSERDGLVDEMRAALLAAMGGESQGISDSVKDDLRILHNMCRQKSKEYDLHGMSEPSGTLLGVCKVLRDIAGIPDQPLPPPPTTISEERAR